MSKRLQHIYCALLLNCLLPTAGAEELNIAVATNFYRTAEALGKEYSLQSGDRITLISGSTGKLYAQVVNGAPVDVFLAADSARPARLEQDSRAVAGSRFTYARGRLVLWSADPQLIDPARGLPEPGKVRHLAIANPHLAPYGHAAWQVLTQLGELDDWKNRLVRGENIGQTYQFVASGNAQAGFVARSQLLSAGGSRWDVPAHLHMPIEQQAVIIRDHEAARRFADWLQSDAARGIIHSFGYDTPGGAHAGSG